MKESLISQGLVARRKIAAPMNALLRLGWFVLLLLIVAVGLTSAGTDKAPRAHASTAASLGYTALGDSLTSKSGYVDSYASYVSADVGVPITLTNLGLPGYSSGGLLYKLANDQAFQDSVRSANLITLMVGINDVGLAIYAYDQGTCGGTDNQNCIRNTATSLRNNFTSILSQIRSINGDRDAVILIADLYNPFIQQQTDDGTLGVFVRLFNRINSDIHSVASANGISVADVYHSFNGADGMQDPIAKGYIAPDGVHANDQGHEEIAAQFRSLNAAVLNGDADGDGFTNGAERYYGADLLASCPRDSSTAAWPPDLTNDGKVTVTDILALVRNLRSPDPRYDLSRDGTVTAIDVLIGISHFGKACPP